MPEVTATSTSAADAAAAAEPAVAAEPAAAPTQSLSATRRPVESLASPEFPERPESPEPVAPSRAKSRRRGEWYGWQTLIADGVAVPFFFATQSRIQTYSLAPYAVLAPTVHFAHGNVAVGFASLTLRLVLPIAGAVPGLALGAVTGMCDRSGTSDDGWHALECVLGSGVIGFGVGVVSAITLDAAVFSYDPPKHRSPPSQARVRLAPSFAFNGQKASVGLTGSF